MQQESVHCKKAKQMLTGHVSAECAICMNKVRPDSMFDVNELCGHVFHTHCAIAYMKSRLERQEPVTCPNCRGSYAEGVWRALRNAGSRWKFEHITAMHALINRMLIGTIAALPLKTPPRPSAVAASNRRIEVQAANHGARLSKALKKRRDAQDAFKKAVEVAEAKKKILEEAEDNLMRIIGEE